MNSIRLIIATASLAAVFAFTGCEAKDKPVPTGNAKPYTLKTCPVSDEKLGSMGDPVVLVHEGREIKLCCDGCLKDFKKESAKYIAKIEAAEKTAK